MSVVKTTTGFPDGTVVKNPPAKLGDVDFTPGWGRSKEMEIQSSILVWESHGQKGLEGYGQRGHKESNKT